MSQEVGLDGQSGIELMVERAAAGEAGAHEGQALRRLVRRRESEPKTMPSSRCGAGL